MQGHLPKLSNKQLPICWVPRVLEFRKLKVLKCEQTLELLSRFATVTESLKINGNCLEEPGVMEYLAKMDCKQIIVRTENLMQEKLREFFSCQSKANKFIDYEYGTIKCFQTEQYDWAWNYFTQKCINKLITIEIDKQIEDVEVFFETLFNGSLKIFKHKSFNISKDIFNGNVCARNGDTHTQRLWTKSWDTAVLALNNCTSLTRLEIHYVRNCMYQQLKVEKLPLQELIFDSFDYKSLPLISDILNKSKDTLSSLECNAIIDLSSLRNSTQLTKLKIRGDIRGTIWERKSNK